MTVRREYNREQNSRATRAQVEEEERQVASALAMKMRRTPRNTSRIKCYKCDEFGHMIRDCPNPPGKNYRPRSNERDDSGKAMTTSVSDIGRWALSMRATTLLPSKWMWDEDYGVKCEFNE